MLFIKTSSRQFQWHVGEPFPQFDRADYPVISFQADGHELYYVMAALDALQPYSYQIGVEGLLFTVAPIYTGEAIDREETE